MVAAASIAAGFSAALYFWFLPAILAQPLLRAVLITEHTGCSKDGNGLSNTRTTLASAPIRLLMWNMPYHAEHHAYPAIPFHALPRLHARVRGKIENLEAGYVRASVKVARYLLRG